MDFGRVVKSFGAQTTDDSLNNYSLFKLSERPAHIETISSLGWETFSAEF